MNDAQDEIAQLKLEVEQLRKALGERQQLSVPDLPALRDNFEFVTDCARFSENLISEAAVRKKYGFSEDTWSRLGEDDALVRAIEDEKTRRIRSGAAKREKAQQHVVRAPDVLEKILTDEKASPKHRIDAAKVLEDLADNGPQAAAEQDRVIVTINLGGGDVLRFDASAKPIPPSDTAKLDDGKLIEHESRPRGVPGFEVD